VSSNLPAAAIVPAAPIILSSASPGQPAPMREAVANLRHAIEEAVGGLPPTDAVLLVGAGAGGFHDHAAADLRPLGVHAPVLELPVATPVIEDLTRLTQYPRFRGEPLGVELTILTRIVGRILGQVPVVPVSVPRGPEADVLRAVGASLHEALEDVDATATVVAAGDLSAGLHDRSPAYLIEGAAAYDAAIVQALEHDDLGSLARYGPDEAERVRARGWPSIVVAAGAAAAARLRPVEVSYHAPCGVGGLVAHLVGRDAPLTRRYEIAGGRTGVLEKPYRPDQ